MIGFRPQQLNRRPLFTSTSKKVGYIADGNIYTDLHGKKIAKILRYKNGSGPYTDASACSGTVIHPEF